MFQFSIKKDSRIQEKVFSDIKIIRRILLEKFRDNVVALFLVGGFGRGEGGVIFEDNVTTVVNDYDLHMITKRAISEREITAICSDISQKTRVHAVDLVVQPIYNSFTLRNTQYARDLKYGSHLIYGNKEILQKLPSSKQLHRSEIEKLLFVRSWCFLGPIEKNFFNEKPLNKKEIFFLFQQLSKALLALEEAWLIYQQDYSPSYLEKFDNIQKYCRDNTLIGYFEWATTFKLQPSYKIKLSPVDTYFDIKDLFLQKMLQIINKAYNRNFDSWVKYTSWYLRRLDIFFKSVISALVYHKLSYMQLVKLYLSRILLAYAFNREDFDKVSVEKAGQLLLGTRPSHSGNIEEIWWNLRQIAIQQELVK